jgi:hypothetical protein
MVEKLALQGLIGIHSKLRVLRQALRQEQRAMFSPLGSSHSFVDVDIASLVPDICLIVTVSFDWVVPQQQHMSYNAETKYVAFVVVWFFVLPTVLDDLWSHVTHGAASFVTLGSDPVV